MLDSGASGPVRALAGDIVLCSWARHFTLTVPLSTQVYIWVPANLMLGVSLAGLASLPGEIEIPLVASFYGNRDKLRPDDPRGSFADFSYLIIASLTSITLKFPVMRGTYHLHGKTGNSSWKIKWFTPFHLESFRKYGL